MSGSSDRVVAYVEEQLATIKRYPLMWGPAVAVELTYLQLLETLLVAHRPDLDATKPRYVKNEYGKFLDRRFPDLGGAFLSRRLREDRIEALIAALAEFVPIRWTVRLAGAHVPR